MSKFGEYPYDSGPELPSWDRREEEAIRQDTDRYANDIDEVDRVPKTRHDVDFNVDAETGWGRCRKCGAMFHDDLPCSSLTFLYKKEAQP